MLETAIIYLAAAIIAVPVAKRLGLGSVLGYLLAGILIGPFVLSLVGDQTDVMHFAEFGVVMMLFLVGLELQPSRLWAMRKSILGLGGLQVVLTTAMLYLALEVLFDLPWQTSLTIGSMLALSSTAIVLQSLTEKGWMKSEAGKNAFAVLLFQDIAVIPMLALLPLLAFTELLPSTMASHTSWVYGMPAWQKVSISVVTIAAIIAAGKYISAPIFRYIAATRLREIFTVFALFLVISIALLMQKIGLSPALGTFLAGVVLAESEFRHELEVDIEPFKGLLLGLFFITVGASIDFELLANQLTFIMSMVIGLIVIKLFVLLGLAKLFKLTKSQGLLFTLALAQGGEFAFVLISLANSLQIIDIEIGKTITLVVAISMVCAPLLLLAFEKFTERSAKKQATTDDISSIESTQHVIIAGYGRFGQIIGRLLSAQGYHLSILDHSPSQIDLLRRFGNKVFYGDAARKDLLEAAGADEAKMLVIAIDEPDKTLEMIHQAKKHFPNLKIVARAIDRRHAYEIMKLGVDCFKRETFDSAINLGIEALKILGNSDEAAAHAGKLFAEHDESSLEILAELWGDDQSYGIAVHQRAEDLKQVLKQDQQAESELNICHEEQRDKNNKLGC